MLSHTVSEWEILRVTFTISCHHGKLICESTPPEQGQPVSQKRPVRVLSPLAERCEKSLPEYTKCSRVHGNNKRPWVSLSTVSSCDQEVEGNLCTIFQSMRSIGFCDAARSCAW